MHRNPVINTLANAEMEGIDHKKARSMLVALMQKEFDVFFPDGIDLDESALEMHIARDRQMKPAAWERLIEDQRPEIVLTSWSTPYLNERICSMPGFPIKYICHIGGTVRSLLPVELIERGVLVSNWGNLVARSVAEHAILLVMACARNLSSWSLALDIPIAQQHLRTSVLNTLSLHGRRVGIHGFGHVARELATLLKPFDVSMRFYSADVSPSVIRNAGMEAADSLGDLFAESDVLIECEALTPTTQGTVTSEILSKLPEDAIFVNVGRGALVDEDALAHLAESGRLRVATDVAISEPVSMRSPLRQVNGILVSPHIAGPTRDIYHRCGLFSLENIRRYIRGESLKAPVTRDVYMRST